MEVEELINKENDGEKTVEIIEPVDPDVGKISEV